MKMNFVKLRIENSKMISPLEDIKKLDTLILIGGNQHGTAFAAGCKGVPTTYELLTYLSEVMRDNPVLAHMEVCMMSSSEFIRAVNKNIQGITPVAEADLPPNLKQEAEMISKELDILTQDVHSGRVKKEVLGARIQELAKEGKFLIPSCSDPNCIVCTYIKALLPPQIMDAIEKSRKYGTPLNTLEIDLTDISPSDIKDVSTNKKDTIEEELEKAKKSGKFFIPEPGSIQ